MPIISEGKRIKGQEYDILRNKVEPDGKIGSDSNDDNHAGTTSLGKGGVLDSVAQRHIEDLDLEKEKVLSLY